MSDIYSNDLLELAADIPHIGRLSAPHGSAHKVSRICGSELTLDLKLDEGRICELGLELQACALGQASASVFARSAIGADQDEIRAAAADYRQRHGSILLAFDAAVEAFEAAIAHSQAE